MIRALNALEVLDKLNRGHNVNVVALDCKRGRYARNWLSSATEKRPRLGQIKGW